MIEQLTGIALHEEHVRDARNPRHPSFFEATDSYEMVIFQGLAPTTTARYDALKTRPTAFILLPRLLVTVRPEDSVSIELVKSQLRSGRKSRVQTRPIDLMILILSAMVDRFLALRDGLADELTDWQDRLLDEEDPFDDWMELMRARNRLRRLVVIGEGQEDTMLSWREETEHPIEGSLEVRVNDLIEHIRRVKQEVKNLQTDIEALVQIHFAAVAHRTNLIVRALTVITAVFLPLTHRRDLRHEFRPHAGASQPLRLLCRARGNDNPGVRLARVVSPQTLAVNEDVRVLDLHRIVVIGGGFGGLEAVRGLRREKRALVTLVDKRNFHLFQPLLYQVATGGLSPRTSPLLCGRSSRDSKTPTSSSPK